MRKSAAPLPVPRTLPGAGDRSPARSRRARRVAPCRTRDAHKEGALVLYVPAPVVSGPKGPQRLLHRLVARRPNEMGTRNGRFKGGRGSLIFPPASGNLWWKMTSRPSGYYYFQDMVSYDTKERSKNILWCALAESRTRSISRHHQKRCSFLPEDGMVHQNRFGFRGLSEGVLISAKE
jgi:hypothetical protein